MRCFTAGTAVLTADGSVAIEDIESGDLVVARAAGLGRWEDLDHAPAGFPQAGDEVVRLGSDVVGRVDALGAGATFVFEDGVFQTDETGQRIRWTGEVLAPVGDTMRRVAASRIDLEIRYDDGHIGTIEATPEHPFFVEGEGWVPLGELVTGDVLAVEGGRTAVVVGLTGEGSGEVYNFEVLGLHNYHVDDGVVVHNACRLPAALRGGPRNVHVYHGMRGNRTVYAGITNNPARRASQHGARFDLRRLPVRTVTRGQARAIEQALIERNRYLPGFQNIRNSISPNHAWSGEAIEWGRQWLLTRGL